MSRGLTLRLPPEQPLEVTGIANPRVGLEASHVLRDAIPAKPDLDLRLLNHDFHGLANMLIGHAISNCIDINKAVCADATFQAAGANGQGAYRQRAQGVLLVSLEANGGPFLGGAVNPTIGDLDHPSRQVTLQPLERVERSPSQGVVLDIANTAFDLPLGAGTTRATGLGRQSTIAAEYLESWIPDHMAGLTIVGRDQRRSVVAEHLLGEAAEVPEGPIEPLEPVVLPLRRNARQ